MQRTHQILGAALLALGAGAAHADPQSGFGLDAGIANHSVSGNTTIAPVTPLSYNSSGLSLGLDYQFALSNDFSFNPFLMTSAESAGGLPAGVNAGHGILGLQLRFWSGDLFFGGHLAHYTESLHNSNTRVTTSGNGGGIGLVMGWESPQGGLFVLGQVDSARINYVDANVRLRAIRLSGGYRWK